MLLQCLLLCAGNGLAAAFYRCCHISDTGETRGIENFVALSDATWERAHKILADRGWRAFELWEAFRQLIGNDAPGTAVERFHEISAEDAKRFRAGDRCLRMCAS